jgi:serine protease AprX
MRMPASQLTHGDRFEGGTHVPGRHNFQFLASLAASLLIGSSAVAPAASASSTTVVSLDPDQKIHPLLQDGAQVDPTALVRVIVQKTRADVASSVIAATIPGLQVSEDYHYIPAFVATLPQAAVATLALDASVRYISPDASVQVIPSVPQVPSKPAPRPPAPKPVAPPKTGFDSSNLLTTFPFVSGATKAWSGAATRDDHRFSGVNMSVAVIDSGVDATHPDISGQVLAVNVNRSASGPDDGYGHGTHVAAIINGHDADGQYYGIAPSATVISVKIADDKGQAYESDLLRGIDWVRANRDAYHIRAVNLSVSSGVAAGYAVSPVDAAVERLWKDNVTVVAAAGNLGSAQDAVWYAPGNDPYVITVGCLDDNRTVAPDDDSLCPISSRGITQDGFAKPDLVAPGRKIVSALSSGINQQGSVLAGEFPDRITADGEHLRLSGTSMAAPNVTGALALLLQRHGGLQPNQLRQLLLTTDRTYPGQPDQAGVLNIPAALVASDHPPSGDHYRPLPADGTAPAVADATTLLWDGSRWAEAYYDGSRWTSTQLNGSRWGAAEWDGSRWTSAYWNGSRWAQAYWNGSRWGGSAWDSDSSLD